MKWDEIQRFVQARLSEPSSIRGLVWLAAGTGVLGKGAATDISASEAMIALGAIVAGVVGLLTKDKQVVLNAITVTNADTVEHADTVLGSQITNQQTAVSNANTVTQADNVERAQLVMDSSSTTILKGKG